MSLTALDKKAALVVIDLQKGIVSLPTAQSAAEIVDRAAQLAKAFRERGLPVVLVNVTGMAPGRTQAQRPAMNLPADWSELVPELDVQPSDILISKQRFGAFLNTDLDHILRDHGVTQIFLAGVATSVGVESTARSAYDLGYNVVLIVDAMTDRSAEAHAYCVDRIFPRIGEIETSDNLLRVIKAPAQAAD